MTPTASCVPKEKPGAAGEGLSRTPRPRHTPPQRREVCPRGVSPSLNQEVAASPGFPSAHHQAAWKEKIIQRGNFFLKNDRADIKPQNGSKTGVSWKTGELVKHMRFKKLTATREEKRNQKTRI